VAIKLLGFCAVLVAITFLLLGGCKVEITVPKGGDVITASGSYRCVSGRVCTIDINDVFFDETFIAEPSSGHIFIGWKKGWSTDGAYFCGGKVTPCHLTTGGFGDHPILMAILETGWIFNLEPIFVKGTPIAEAISRIADGVFRECVQSWAKDATYAEEVTEIRCTGYTADVKSIEGIQAFLALKKLMLNAWKYDLAPLSDLSYLQYLRLYIHPDADLSPLRNLSQLDHLEMGIFQEETTCATYAGTQWRCTGDGIKNFDALANLTKLTFLNLFIDNPDLKVVGQLIKLKTLYSYGSFISDVSPLGALTKLKSLHLASNEIEDITALETLIGLEQLDLARNQIKDIGPLTKLKKLWLLNLSGNVMEDITPLKGLPLGSLGIAGNKIEDIGPLAGLAKFNPPSGIAYAFFLNASDNRINDIKSLGTLDHDLVDLYLDNNAITDLEPLSRIKLHELHATHNVISDIGPLANLPLRYLYLSFNKIKDISALETIYWIQYLELDHNQISDISPLKTHYTSRSPYSSPPAHLKLQSNKISRIDGALDGIEQGEIYLQENPILCSERQKYLASKPAYLDVYFSPNCVE
jgi:Leucine-rich repeat (LRR) protein